MTPKELVGGTVINDGKGLLDAEGMFDSLLTDLNTALKCLYQGQYIAHCDAMHGLAVKILALKKGVLDEIKSKDEQIIALRTRMEE